MNRMKKIIPGRNFLLPLLLLNFIAVSSFAQELKWTQTYSAGYTDQNGSFAGGSEIMHIVSHKGKLYASNGYWCDARWVIPPEGQKQSAQVIRLDSPEAQWQVDLDMGKSNGHGLEYMKGNILKSVTLLRMKMGTI